MHTIPVFQRHAFMLLLLSSLALPACKTSQASTASTSSNSAEKLWEQVQRNYLKFDWLSSRAKLNYKDAQQDIQLQVNLKMQRDSLIWLSFTKLGIEGARVRITPTRIQIIDRINRQYIERDFNFMYQFIPVKLSFSDLQQLIVGNAIDPLNSNWSSEVKPEHYQLKTQNDKLGLQYWIEPTQFRMKAMSAVSAQDSVQVQLSDFTPTTGGNLAQNIVLQTFSPQKGQVSANLILNKIDFTRPENLSFDIPEDYEKI